MTLAGVMSMCGLKGNCGASHSRSCFVERMAHVAMRESVADSALVRPKCTVVALAPYALQWCTVLET